MFVHKKLLKTDFLKEYQYACIEIKLQTPVKDIWVSHGEDVSVGLVDRNAILRVEDGESMFPRRAGIYPQVYMALQPRRPTPTLHQRVPEIRKEEHDLVRFVFCALSP